jgi:5-carboxymethyl-2-hydroxymuconate isomerase
VYIGVRIGAGRNETIRKQAGGALFNAACEALADAYAAGPLAISLELSEIEPVTSFKKNNIHERLDQKSDSSKD